MEGKKKDLKRLKKGAKWISGKRMNWMDGWMKKKEEVS